MARGRPSRQTIYAQLDDAIEDLRCRMGGLPSPAEAEEIWSDLWHQEAHHEAGDHRDLATCRRRTSPAPRPEVRQRHLAELKELGH